MVLSFFNLLLAILLIACFGSFTWGVRRFFVKQERRTVALQLTLLMGTVFAVLHVVVILMTADLRPGAVAGAAVLYVASFAIFWWAIGTNRAKPLSACFSRDEELHLVRSGPYRFVRHPFYCSYLLAWLAGVIGTLNPWLTITFVVMFFLYLNAAITEENKFAAGPLAEEYAAYRHSTGRFLPKP